jgi:hypothetical protein
MIPTAELSITAVASMKSTKYYTSAELFNIIDWLSTSSYWLKISNGIEMVYCGILTLSCAFCI